MDWNALIIAMVKEFAPLILECFNRDKSAARARMRNLGPLETIRIRRSLRKHGVPPAMLGESVARVRSDLNAASDAELDELIAMAEGFADTQTS